jgi:hypothetical protein
MTLHRLKTSFKLSPLCVLLEMKLIVMMKKEVKHYGEHDFDIDNVLTPCIVIC